MKNPDHCKLFSPQAQGSRRGMYNGFQRTPGNADHKWHHVSSISCQPPLLCTCRSSRKAALQYQETLPAHGFMTKLHLKVEETDYSHDEPENTCLVYPKLRAYSKTIHWNPNTDAVLLTGGETASACNSDCELRLNHYDRFFFDKWLKYVIMPLKLWTPMNAGSGLDNAARPKWLRIAFLLVEDGMMDRVKTLNTSLPEAEPWQAKFHMATLEEIQNVVLYWQGHPLTEEQEESRLAFYKSYECTADRGLFYQWSQIEIRFVSSVEDALQQIDRVHEVEKDIPLGEDEFDSDSLYEVYDLNILRKYSRYVIRKFVTVD